MFSIARAQRAAHLSSVTSVLLANPRLSAFTAYEALAILPVAFILGFSFNPSEFLWGLRCGLRGGGWKPMPTELREKADRVRRYANLLGSALILGLVGPLMLRASIPPTAAGLHLANWKSNSAIGATAGALLVASQRLLLEVSRVDPQGSFFAQVRKGPVAFWAFCFLVGSFAEELWVALSLVALRTTGHSLLVCVAATVMVFAAAHYAYGPGGVAAVATKGTLSALLFLWRRSLVPTFLFHFLGNLGSLYWARRRP